MGTWYRAGQAAGGGLGAGLLVDSLIGRMVGATTAVAAIALNGSCFRGKAATDHELGHDLMGRFSRLLLDRLQATQRQLLDVYGSTDRATSANQN